MAKPIKLKIDVTKIDKSLLYKGEKGTYLNCVVWENRDGPDRFDFTHTIKQEISKEQKEAGMKEVIIGNLKMPDDGGSSQRSSSPDRGFSRPSGGRDYPLKDREPNGRQKAPVDDNEPFDF